jgi:hypothetical protein
MYAALNMSSLAPPEMLTVAHDATLSLHVLIEKASNLRLPEAE